MTKGIPLEEAKRRRAEREAKAREQRQDQPKPNGHAAKVRQLQTLGLHELGNVEAQDQLVHGIIGDNQLAVLFGESGSGKSFLGFDMAAHLALKKDWLGHKVGGGGVLYIAAEGRGGWANRVEAFCRHHKLDDEERAMAPFAFVLESINLGRNGTDVAAVIDAAKRVQDQWQEALRLVVIDTVARAMPGSNENDAVDMGAFIANMDAIREATRATQIGVHHSGKNAALGARGHSSLRAAVDIELEVERLKASRVLRVRKSRDGFDGFSQAFDLLKVDLGISAQGETLTSCVVQGSEVEQPTEKPRKVPKSEKLLHTVINQALDRFGIELQLSDGRPKVKAVDLEHVKTGYIRRKANLPKENAARIFNRTVDKASEAEVLLVEQMSGTTYVFWPWRQ